MKLGGALALNFLSGGASIHLGNPQSLTKPELPETDYQVFSPQGHLEGDTYRAGKWHLNGQKPSFPTPPGANSELPRGFPLLKRQRRRSIQSVPSESNPLDSHNGGPGIHEALERVRKFCEEIRDDIRTGHTGRVLKDFIAIGADTAHSGSELVLEALNPHSSASVATGTGRLRFLGNGDPKDSAHAMEGLDPETTLAVVISKSFMTRDTLLAAKTVKDWLLKALKEESAVGKYFAACTTNFNATSEFGFSRENVVGFWNSVGTQPLGLTPLHVALHYGFATIKQLLHGRKSNSDGRSKGSLSPHSLAGFAILTISLVATLM